jgi:predicted RNA-binding Zn-ribbon protein involved in translation (DUF1610 family)
MKVNYSQGTWGVRVLINFFTIIIGILFFWLLGFLVEDIETIKGPDQETIEKKYVDHALIQKQSQIQQQITDLSREITNRQEEQRLASDSSQNLQRTINQLLELQRLSIQKAVPLSESERINLSVSLSHFFESQKTYQELNQKIAELSSKKQQLDEENRRIEQQITKQKKPAREDYERQNKAHRLRLAMYQLLILVPLLLIAGYLLLKRRHSLYFPLFLAFGGATLLKVSFVIHEYFPSRIFRYILIVVLLLVAIRLLIFFIRVVAFPKIDWLLKQYREAYERFLCPVCNYPIRTGPRRFLFWTRRTVHKILPQYDSWTKEEAYTCPSCGTLLFQPCPSCQQIRHALLEHCEHCGFKKEIDNQISTTGPR